MEGFNFTNTSQNNISDHDDIYTIPTGIKVVTCIIISIGLCLTPIAIYAVCSLVRKDHVAPIYVINLLISDLIQFCGLIVLVAAQEHLITFEIGFYLYKVAFLASVGFMVCVAVERYLVIARPLWYRFRGTIKTPVVICIMVWVLPPVLISSTFWIHFKVYLVLHTTYLLLPLPLFIFFLGGTITALSASRVPSDEKRRIVGILVLVLLIYTLLFSPIIMYNLATGKDYTLHNVPFLFVQLRPLADLFLYAFMRRGAIDKFLASVCCCRMDSNDITSPAV